MLWMASASDTTATDQPILELIGSRYMPKDWRDPKVNASTRPPAMTTNTP